jgi:lysozyme
MIFNLGLSGFLNFKKMIAALGAGDYELASKEMLNSKWAKQVRLRSISLSNMMRKGDWVELPF